MLNESRHNDSRRKIIRTVELPIQFGEAFRPDIIKRAFYAIQNNKRQPYGTNLFAGLRTSAEFKGRRRDYGSHQNRGMHRTKRIRMRSGHMTGKARGVPGAVKRPQSPPPMADRIWTQKINDKERKLAHTISHISHHECRRR